MSKDETNADKFRISLRESGVNSLWKGIELFERHTITQDDLLLRDAIIFLHHGVELLMKEVLVRHSQFLIFEDLRDASRKQKKADESGVGIFFLDKPPRTVTFGEAVSRVDAFVKASELTNDLQASLAELNRLRNQLEHYAIDTDREEVTRLLADLHDPLLELFEAHIGGIKRLQTPEVIRAWNRVQDSADFYSKLEREVFELVEKFRGQVVPGRLFNVEGEITLPTFVRVLSSAIVSSEEGVQYEVDILGEGQGFSWAIEVKAWQRAINTAVIDQLAFWSQVLRAKVWLVAFSEVTEMARRVAQRRGILVTGQSEWEELKGLIESENL